MRIYLSISYLTYSPHQLFFFFDLTSVIREHQITFVSWLPLKLCHLRSIHAIILDVQHLRLHLHNSSLLVLVLRKKIQTAALEPCATSTLIFSL
ncbi:hypothetical protein H9Q74_007514 [Fusarium xylarioides]|nr:hypothetical protein H9Q73_000277 [Fusarium xylarioides]KAG5808223.1 hypothetical protein H9Q71_007251 [Fusarium xylarioides]KAG5822376.1 hypothetical protein H9Q74_007514 [Fusarium xylarioides]